VVFDIPEEGVVSPTTATTQDGPGPDDPQQGDPLVVSPRTRRLSPTRAQQYRAERAAIVNAAYRLIGATPLHSTSVHEILREAGLGTRAFYRYFASKDDLVLHMYRTDSERVTAALDAAVAAAQTPLDALEAWVDTSLAAAYDPSDPRQALHVATLSSHEAAAVGGFDEVMAAAFARQRASLERVLRHGRSAGAFPFADPEPDAFAVQAVVVTYLRTKVLGGPCPSRAAVRRHVVDLFARALGASSVTRAAATAPARNPGAETDG
jgi:AcrR family transcriptional regulator